MATDNEVIVPNNLSVDPTITESDNKAVDSLLDEVLKEGGDATKPNAEPEKKPDVVQAPEKPEGEKPKEEKVNPEVPANGTVTETPEQKAAKDKLAKDAEASKTPDKELEAIQPPKHLSPANKSGWETLRTLAKARGEQLAAAQKEIEALKPQVGKPDPKISEELTAAKTELAKYQALYQGERSPEFVAKYAGIQKSEDSALNILRENGYGLNDKDDPDNLSEEAKARQEAAIAEVVKVGIHKKGNEWEEGILNALPRRARVEMQAALDESFKLRKERDEELSKIKDHPEEFQKQVEAETTQKFQSYTKELAETVQSLTKDIPWANQQAIPEGATPEVKAKIEADNQFQKELEGIFQKSLYPATPQTRAETALTVCLAHKLAKDNSDLTAYAKAIVAERDIAVKELEAIKKAGITSGAGRNVSSSEANRPIDTSKMSDDDAIEAGLKAAGA